MDLLDRFRNKNKKQTVNGYFITETGRLVQAKSLEVKNGKIEFKDGTYSLLKGRKLLDEKNNIVFVFHEKFSDPLDLVNLKKSNDVKIDAKAVKGILKAKLFHDLFYSGDGKMLDLIVNVIVFINTLLLVVIALKVYGIFGPEVLN